MSEYFDTLENAKAHIHALWRVAQADGVIHESEINHINAILSGYSRQFPELASEFREPIALEGSLEDALSVFKSIKSKRLLLQDAFSLAICDGVFDQSEKEWVREIGRILAVSPGDIDFLFETNLRLLETKVTLARFIFGDE